MVRAEFAWDVPMCVTLPIEVLSPQELFPFLDCTLADLGIAPSAVKERVVWIDTKRTQVRSASGKLKEKEVVVLEVRLKAQQPGDPQTQEILYSTESHTNRSYCRNTLAVQPWKLIQSENILQPVEIAVALDTELQTKWTG